MSKRVLPVKGTSDFLPKEAKKREKMKEVIFDTYLNNGFLKIETPILENLDFLLGSEGGENLRLIFKILKRGKKLKINNINDENDLADLGLRYDLTIPLARYYLNNKEELPQVFKAIQIGDVFRAERPQKGRSRQFLQCDIDILNEKSNLAEIELLITSSKALINLGLKDFTFKINDRRILNQLILNEGFKKDEIEIISIILDKLSKKDKEEILKEFGSKKLDLKKANNLIEKIFKIKKEGVNILEKYNIDSNIVENIKEIIQTVNSYSNSAFEIEFDISIVRGQGYYTSTIFELFFKEEEFSFGGGGRYDGMIERISGLKAEAVGFSLGFERLFLITDEKNLFKDQKNNLIIFYDEEKYNKKNLLDTKNKNSIKYNVAFASKNKNFSFQLKKYKNLGFDYYMELEKKDIIKLKEGN